MGTDKKNVSDGAELTENQAKSNKKGNLIKTVVFGGEGLSENQEKLRKLFMYLVSGFLTTVANWIVYIAFDKLVQSDMEIDLMITRFSLKIAVASSLAWIVSVLVAYFLNRITVFRSKGSIGRELLAFAGARVVSFLIIELGILYLMVWICELITGAGIHTPVMSIGRFDITYNYVVKLLNSVLVIIANYVMSKLLVFKKKDMVDYTEKEESSAEEAEADA